MTRVVRWLRLDDATWTRWDKRATAQGAALLTVGAYVAIAFDRFGIQGFSEPRGAARIVLAGFYGWAGLSAAMWIIARRRGGVPGLTDLLRLVGQAHVPVLMLGLVIQGLSVTLRLQGPAKALAVFSLLFWMPALLVNAASRALDIPRSSTWQVVAIPYIAWAVVVGRFVFDQVGHLL